MFDIDELATCHTFQTVYYEFFSIAIPLNVVYILLENRMEASGSNGANSTTGTMITLNDKPVLNFLLPAESHEGYTIKAHLRLRQCYMAN